MRHEGSNAKTLERATSVRAWDLPTRLFHWILVALLVAGYLTRNLNADPSLYWHRLIGYAVLTLLIFRILWGFVGSSTSRFRTFFPRPLAALHYARDLTRRTSQHHLGHNPLGSVLIFAMLIAVLAQAGTGLFETDHVTAEGPLHKFASPKTEHLAGWYHAKGFWIIAGLALVHIAANLAYQFIKKDRLIDAMVIGRKPALVYADQQEATIAPAVRAIFCFAVAASIVFGGVALSGDSLLY